MLYFHFDLKNTYLVHSCVALGVTNQHKCFTGASGRHVSECLYYQRMVSAFSVECLQRQLRGLTILLYNYNFTAFV